MKIRPVGAELFHAGSQIMTKLIVAFHSFADAPKTSFNTAQGNNHCLFSDPYKTHKYSLCRQNVKSLWMF
jgi:hypothetical protein